MKNSSLAERRVDEWTETGQSAVHPKRLWLTREGRRKSPFDAWAVPHARAANGTRFCRPSNRASIYGQQTHPSLAFCSIELSVPLQLDPRSRVEAEVPFLIDFSLSPRNFGNDNIPHTRQKKRKTAVPELRRNQASRDC
jgi:hypothetical protein